MLTDRRQQQALADFVHGLDMNLNPAQLQDPYDFLYRAIADLPAQERYQAIIRLKLAEDLMIREAIDQILSLEPGYQPRYENLAEIGPTLPEIEWLWRGWLPRGYLTILAAAPGVGKSYFALDLARRLIDGMDAPDGQPFEVAASPVIYVDAEDFLPVLYGRVQKWGMDCTQFYPFQRPARSIIDLEDPLYQDQLIDMVYDLRPRLVIVDSLSRVNRRGENSIEEVRGVLDFLVELPRAFDCGMILIHHLRKRSSSQLNLPVTIHDIRGTGDLVAAGRCIMALDAMQTDQDGEPNGPRRLKILKTNLTKYPKPLAINFTPLPGEPDYVYLEYGDVALYQGPTLTKTEECAGWLVETLAGGPQSYAELKEAVEEELGFNESILQRARRSLGIRIVDTHGRRHPENKWALADEELADDEEEGDDERETTEVGGDTEREPAQ